MFPGGLNDIGESSQATASKGKFNDGKLGFYHAKDVEPFMKKESATQKFCMVDQTGKFYVSYRKGFYASGSRDDVFKRYKDHKKQKSSFSLKPMFQTDTALWRELAKSCRDTSMEQSRTNSSSNITPMRR